MHAWLVVSVHHHVCLAFLYEFWLGKQAFLLAQQVLVQLRLSWPFKCCYKPPSSQPKPLFCEAEPPQALLSALHIPMNHSHPS